MMKMKVWHMMTLIVGLALTACNKTPIPVLPEGNDPIYMLKGQVNGEDLDYKVGLESVVINRGVKIENGLTTYYGEMESVTNSEKIRVEFIQQETPQSGSDVQVFANLNVPFLVHDSAKVRFDFGGFGGGQGGFFYLLDDGGNMIKGTEHTVHEFGFLHKKAIFLDVNTEPYIFTIKHGFENNDLISEYVAEGVGDTIHLASKAEYPLNEWYINGILVGTEVDYTGPIEVGIHRIVHRIMDANGNQSETDGFVRFKDGKQLWDMSIIYEDETEYEANNYGRVIVSMFKNGQWYSSDFAPQNRGKEALIENVQSVPFEAGEEPLVAFDIDFDAVLYNESKTESLTLSNMDGKFIVGLR